MARSMKLVIAATAFALTGAWWKSVAPGEPKPPAIPSAEPRHAPRPRRGFLKFMKELWNDVNSDRIFSVAAGVGFYGLLSLVPALAALIALYGLFTDRATAVDQVARLSSILPAEVATVIFDQATRIAGQPGQTLGFAFALSLVLSLWSANSAMKEVFDALNVAFEESEKRGVVRLNLQSLGFTLFTVVFALLAIAAVIILPLLLRRVGLDAVADNLISIGRWPVLLAVVSLGIAVLYRFGPSHTHPKWRWATPGIAFASLSWLALSGLFSWYAANFGKFNQTYGSLGAAAVLLTWMWLSALLVLTGAEIDSNYYEHDARPK